MNINDYRETISDIKATESLKRRIVSTLKSGEETKRLKFRRQVIIAVAACMSVAIMIPVMVLTLILPAVTPSGNSTVYPPAVAEPSSDPELPKLTIVKDNGRNQGTGLGYKKEAINERNPWSEEFVMDTFPVYKNFSVNLNVDEMIAKGKETADTIGIPEANWVIHPEGTEIGEIIAKKNEKDEDNTADNSNSDGQRSYDIIIMNQTLVVLICDDLWIYVDETGSISMRFKPAFELPDEYKGYLKNTTNEKLDKVAEYLSNKFNLSDIKSPASRAIISNDRVVNLSIYNKEADYATRMLEFYFPHIDYDFDSELNLIGIYLYDYKLNEKIGDYPMITVQEAKKLLLENKYISAYKDMPKEERIYKVQLELRTMDDILIPYYVFYIEAPSLEKENQQIYGTYYVPAIKSKYFTNFPGEGPLDFLW